MPWIVSLPTLISAWTSSSTRISALSKAEKSDQHDDICSLAFGQLPCGMDSLKEEIMFLGGFFRIFYLLACNRHHFCATDEAWRIFKKVLTQRQPSQGENPMFKMVQRINFLLQILKNGYQRPRLWLLQSSN